MTTADFLILAKSVGHAQGGLGAGSGGGSLDALTDGLSQLENLEGFTVNDAHVCQGAYDYVMSITIDPDRYNAAQRYEPKDLTAHEIVTATMVHFGSVAGVMTDSLALTKLEPEMGGRIQRAVWNCTWNCTGLHGAARIGQMAVSDDVRTLDLRAYVDDAARDAVELSVPVPQPRGPWKLLGNSKEGDCAMAAAGHAQQAWAAPGDADPDITSAGVMDAYHEARIEYRTRGAGIAPLDALDYWRQRGVCGHRIAAYAEVTERTVSSWVTFAIERFGCAYAVLELPDAAAPSGVAPEDLPAWDAAMGRGNEGKRHAVVYVAYDPEKLTAVTFGMTKEVTWEFNESYCKEMYVPLRSGEQPAGVNVERWMADAAEASRTPRADPGGPQA